MFVDVSTPATKLRILEQQTLKEFLPAHGFHEAVGERVQSDGPLTFRVPASSPEKPALGTEAEAAGVEPVSFRVDVERRAERVVAE